MPFRITQIINKADIQAAMSDQGYTISRAGKLDRLDAAVTTRPSGADYTAGRAAYIDNLIGLEPSGVYVHPDGVAEQDAVVIAPAELGEYKTLLLDLSNLTQDTTIRTYVQVDGANYKLNDAAVFPTDFPAETKVVGLKLVPASVRMKVTLRSALPEGADRVIPWRYVVQSLA